MISIIPNKMPHIELFTRGDIRKDNIQRAYRDIITAHNGVRVYVSILDCIFERFYSLSEVTTAGVIVADSIDGYFIKNALWEPARYIRINECDMVILKGTNEVLADTDIFQCKFENKTGIRYELKTGEEILHKKKKTASLAEPTI